MPARRGTTLSLRHLLILLTAIGFLPLALLGTWSIKEAADTRRNEQERSMLKLARALSSAVDAELDGAGAALAGMAHMPALQNGDLAAFYQLARQQAQAQPEWLGILLADGAGRVVFRTTAPYGAPATPIADPSSMRQALGTDGAVVGNIARGPGGRAAFPVRLPVSTAAGRPYVLTAIIQPDRVLNVIRRQRVPNDWVISVTDATGMRVARTRDHERTLGQPASATLLRLMTTGPEGTGETVTVEGEPAITAYTTSPRYGWAVSVGASVAGLRQQMLERYAVYAAALLLTLAACIGAASLLARRIVARIDRLQRAATALGTVEALEVAPSRIREIDTMGCALLAAAARRDEREMERSELLATLEQAVAMQQQALADAYSANRAKDDFLAVLGHELRNPLSPIVASLDLMDLRGDTGAQRERAVMRRQVAHLKRLVDDLLDVSRIASGKLVLDMRPVDLAEIARQAVAAATGMRVALTAPDALWVNGDDNRLAQVLGNLLSNAARFGGGEAAVTVAAEGGMARLSVSDRGDGMSAELQQRVFEPFFQAPQQLARRTGGLGLGLAIVSKIVQLHGGRMTVFSAGPGQGSTFAFALPLAEPALPEAAALEHAVSPGQSVLVVDDNEDAARVTATMLRHIGLDVQVAHTAAQALAAYGARRTDLALLDIGLPDMDGYALARALLAAAAGRPLRLVALTGYGQKGDIERAVAAGFDVHLTKPATLDDLRRAFAPT